MMYHYPNNMAFFKAMPAQDMREALFDHDSYVKWRQKHAKAEMSVFLWYLDGKAVGSLKRVMLGLLYWKDWHTMDGDEEIQIMARMLARGGCDGTGAVSMKKHGRSTTS